MSSLIQCIYASSVARRLDHSMIESLLLCARRRNAEMGISGMLLFTGENFFQVLEGREAAVNSTFERISRDSRHMQIAKIVQEPILKRAFSSWTMGWAAVSGAELSSIAGLNDYFQSRTCMLGIDHGTAKNLLRAFSEGRLKLEK